MRIQGLLCWCRASEFTFQCRGYGFDPWLGTKIPQAMAHLSLSAATREARMLQKRPDAAKKKKTNFFFLNMNLNKQSQSWFQQLFPPEGSQKDQVLSEIYVPTGAAPHEFRAEDRTAPSPPHTLPEPHLPGPTWLPYNPYLGLFWGKALASTANILETKIITGAVSSLPHFIKAKQTGKKNVTLIIQAFLKTRSLEHGII